MVSERETESAFAYPLRHIPKMSNAAVEQVRSYMATRGWTHYIVPTADAHQSEYVADCDKRRARVSGFTGSAGTALVRVGQTSLLWTDSRYFLQAARELDPSHWKLCKDRIPGEPTLVDVLRCESGAATIGYDPELMTTAQVADMQAALAETPHRLVPSGSGENAVDMAWPDRPARPTNELLVLGPESAAANFQRRQAAICSEMAQRKASHLVVTALDEIAYLLNMRGKDILYNPVFFAYLVLVRSAGDILSVHLFLDHTPSAAVAAHLTALQVHLHPYDGVCPFLAAISADAEGADIPTRVWLDPMQVSAALWQSLSCDVRKTAVKSRSPIALLKAVKTDAEIADIRACHVRDGAALCTFLSRLEAQIHAGKTLTEVDAADQLAALRAEQAHFQGLSFETISSSGPNGAIIHYAPQRGSCAVINPEDMYLVDSGGQYLDGTTDVTRTVHFGTPSAHQRRCFTRVLQGFIDVSASPFPEGTSGGRLDCLARAPLWREGLDFGHGTGHGVGHFLNVHEGPHGISYRPSALAEPMVRGMIVTDEPGYYEEGAFGIRIEDVTLVAQLPCVPTRPDGPVFCHLEHLTMAPIQRSLVDVALLSPEQVQWVNTYHRTVLDTLASVVDPKTASWLKLQCEAW